MEQSGHSIEKYKNIILFLISFLFLYSYFLYSQTYFQKIILLEDPPVKYMDYLQKYLLKNAGNMY